MAEESDGHRDQRIDAGGQVQAEAQHEGHRHGRRQACPRKPAREPGLAIGGPGACVPFYPPRSSGRSRGLGLFADAPLRRGRRARPGSALRRGEQGFDRPGGEAALFVAGLVAQLREHRPIGRAIALRGDPHRPVVDQERLLAREGEAHVDRFRVARCSERAPDQSEFGRDQEGLPGSVGVDVKAGCHLEDRACTGASAFERLDSATELHHVRGRRCGPGRKERGRDRRDGGRGRTRPS